MSCSICEKDHAIQRDALNKTNLYSINYHHDDVISPIWDASPLVAVVNDFFTKDRLYVHFYNEIQMSVIFFNKKQGVFS